jgi:uncharacterized protein YdbL (DUF1318 family)
MMKTSKWSNKLIFALLICVVTMAIAVASELTKPKADGLIGEQANGYIGLVTDDVPADIRRLVDEVNARRKAGYQRIADREGTALSEVEKVGGKTAFEKTLKGNYFRDASGTWRKK